ncbi:hypothetical protein RUM43_003262 [Polyplax serrata]|uniref:Uncharacterized protein n=1 Tax=Polyplax serrata TaxID=468196 RepID=A0AAN8NWD6_POLSC
MSEGIPHGENGSSSHGENTNKKKSGIGNLNLTDRQAVESARQLTTDLRNKKQEKTRYWHVTLGMWSQCILGKFTFRYPKRGRKKKAVDMGPTSAASVLLRALHADKNNVFFCRDYLVVGIRRETEVPASKFVVEEENQQSETKRLLGFVGNLTGFYFQRDWNSGFRYPITAGINVASPPEMPLL